MVDLSQDQPLKQKLTPDVPTSDQSPVAQPAAPSKQLDDISSPQITTEEKIATPEQEEIKKELSELGIPPEGRGKKTKVILAALGVLLLAATLPAAVYLVKQRQEIRKEAAPTPKLCTYNVCSGTKCLGVIGPELEPNCPENECSTNADCGVSPKLCTYNVCSGTKCLGVIGPELEPNCPENECSTNADCGVPTPTPTSTPKPTATPTPKPTPTPTPTSSPPEYIAQCEFCKVYDEDWEEITDPSIIAIGQTVYFATRGSTTDPEGITKARFRINGGDWQETTTKHGNEFYISYTILSAGSYTVESMVYNPVLGWY